MDSVRCPSCRLVQFKSDKCRRCKKSLVFQVTPPMKVKVPGRYDPSRRFEGLVSANVKRLRLAKSMGQKRLAELMGVPRTYISKVECRHAEPVLATLLRFADVLGVPVTELFSSERELMSENLLADPFLAEAARLTEAEQVAVLEYAKMLSGGSRCISR